MQIERPHACEVLDCGGKRNATPISPAQRQSDFRIPPTRLKAGSPLRSATALQDTGALAILLGLATALLFSGCTTTPRAQIQRTPNAFPADALITQRGVLTVFGGKQFTLNGYLASSATNGQRLILTENFGGVLADVLVTPDGKAHVMKSSRAFKPKWLERYVAADVRCLFGPAPENDCPGQTLGPNHFLLQRRWYKLDVQIVNIQPGIQPTTLFDASQAQKP